jgi:hypothetical protein
MGLDSVDLLMRIENGFGIEIKGSEAEQITTVGKMYDAVWERLENKRSESCLTQPIFYRLRKAFVEQLGVRHEEFTPAARMEEIVPFDHRRRRYQLLSKQCGFVLPKLFLNNTLATVNTSIGIGIFILGGAIALNYSWLQHRTGFWWLLLIPAIFLIKVLDKAFEPFRNSSGTPLCVNLSTGY